MNKEIFKYILEIIFVIVICIITYFYWDDNNLFTEISYAHYYASNSLKKSNEENLSYRLNSKIEYNNLIPTTYELLNKMDAKYLYIKNNNYYDINYNIQFKISKKSNIKLNDLVLIINDEILKLNEIKYDENYKEYIINSNNYSIEDESIYRILVYLDKDLCDDVKDNSLYVDIDLVEI